MGYCGNGMMAGMLLWGGLGVLLLAAVVTAVVLAVALIARRPITGGGVAGTPTPADILRTRFAAGEIDEDELARRLAALK